MPATTGYAVATISDLKAIDTATRVDGYIRSVTAQRAWYVFVASATDTADDITIVSPTTGTGRWFRTKALVVSADISDLNESIDDRVAALLTSTGTITYTYNDAANSLSLAITTGSITDTHVSSTAAIAQSKIAGLTTALASKADTTHTQTASTITDFNEAVDDRVATLLNSPDGSVTFNYNDAGNLLNVTVGSNLVIEDEGVVKGNASILNFVGTSVDASVTGGEATITIATPSALASTTFTVTSSTLAANASEIRSFAATKIGYLVRLQSDFPARVRVYATNTFASNDLTRPISTELTGEHGCFLECVTVSPSTTLNLAPAAPYYTTVAGDLLYITITNRDTVSRAITITLTYFRW